MHHSCFAATCAISRFISVLVKYLWKSCMIIARYQNNKNKVWIVCNFLWAYLIPIFLHSTYAALHGTLNDYTFHVNSTTRSMLCFHSICSLMRLYAAIINIPSCMREENTYKPNPLPAIFFRGNINIYLHFVSFHFSTLKRHRWLRSFLK